MNIIICGAGEIGSHAAEVLAAADNNITVIDLDEDRLSRLGEAMDIATYCGNCAQADVLAEAGCRNADLLLAATDSDEINLLTATIGKVVGAAKTIARVHHSAYFEQGDFDYKQHLGIDRLICPEFSTAQAIAQKLRNPGALAAEHFARGRIEMQEFTASGAGSAVGRRLMDVRLPDGTRLALVRRKEGAFIPDAKTVVAPGDSIILVGNVGAFEDARKLFQDSKQPRQRVVLMGGPTMAVWLCRSLRDRSFAIRLFEQDRERAEDLAEKLDWVTVIHADPTDRSMFAEENVSQADVFISLLESDEANIIAGVLAKMRGVTQVLTVVQKSKYLDIVYDIGVDHAFSTRRVAGDEIDSVLDERPLRHIGTLAKGFVDVYQIRVAEDAQLLDRPLRDVGLSPDWVVAAIQREENAWVPGAEDTIKAGDTVLVVGKRGEDKTLKRLFAAGS